MASVATRKLRKNTIVNWEGIQEDPEAEFFRGVPRDLRSDEYVKESGVRSRDLELADIAREIAYSNVERLNHSGFSDYTNLNNIYAMIITPLVEKESVCQVRDSVEELKGSPALVTSVDNGFNNMAREERRLRCLFEDKQISFLEYERGISLAYNYLRESLGDADTRLLKDLCSVFGSRNQRKSPFGDYYRIINSPNVKAKVSSAGFELYPDSEEVTLDETNPQTFTPGDGIMTACIENSVQRAKSGSLLNGSRELLSYMVCLATFAEKYGLTKPEFNEAGLTDINRGYHVLLKSTRRRRATNIITHDTRIDSLDKVLAITGPNAGGKSTYIKELGLMSILGQAGSFVPATYANLPVYKRFLTHFSSQDNILEDISTFQAEIHDLNRVLGRMEEGTLLICDELFKGTESGKNGGARLHQGVVEALLRDYPGRTLLSSHYHESLMDQTKIPGIKFKKVDVDRSHIPQYTLSPGIDNGGYAIAAAIRAGLSRTVVARLNGDGHI